MVLSGRKATVKRNQPTASNYGDSYDITFAKSCKFYDVSPYAKSCHPQPIAVKDDSFLLIYFYDTTLMGLPSRKALMFASTTCSKR